MNRSKTGLYARYIKRGLDILFSVIGMLVLWPIALLCAIAIKLDDPLGCVFFTQERNGKDGKVFSIIKFRTMKRHLSGGNIEAINNNLTGVGKVIRKLSLDEIPQLISILRGEMSLIGPRPLPVENYDWFNQTELRRFTIKPGLTGLAQVNGRVNLNWDDRFRLDVEYVENLSFGLDFKIFFQTFLVVFSHKDVLLDNLEVLPNFCDYRKMQLDQNKSMEL